MEPMKIEELKRKTTVYDDISDFVEPISWVRFKNVAVSTYEPELLDSRFIWDEEAECADEVDYSPHVVNYYLGEPDYLGRMYADDLPTEFFNHELMACNESDTEEVRRFIENWGMPFSPIRNDEGCLSDLGSVETLSIDGIHGTDALTETFPEKLGCIVSVKEAKATIAVLKKTVLLLRECIIASKSKENGEKSLIRKDGSMPYMMMGRILSAASCNPFTIKAIVPCYRGEESNRFIPLMHIGRLTSAICNQIISTIANEELPWRKCACDGCDVLFKFQQSNAQTPNSDAYYCCKTHADRQRQRNNRKPRDK